VTSDENTEEDRLARSYAYERKQEDIFNVSFYTDHLSMTSESLSSTSTLSWTCS